MSKPAHSHAQRSLQSVCAVRSHLRRNHAADVAYSAPGTCKQLAPQITAICGGAVLFSCWHPQLRFAPASNTSRQNNSVPQCRQAPRMVSMPLVAHLRPGSCSTAWVGNKHGRETIAPMLLEGCVCGGALRKTSAQHYRPVSVGQSDNRGQQPRRHSKPMKLRELRLRHLGSGNLQTRLARRGASAQYLWLRYPGRSSFVASPRSSQ